MLLCESELLVGVTNEDNLLEIFFIFTLFPVQNNCNFWGSQRSEDWAKKTINSVVSQHFLQMMKTTYLRTQQQKNLKIIEDKGRLCYGKISSLAI